MWTSHAGIACSVVDCRGHLCRAAKRSQTVRQALQELAGAYSGNFKPLWGGDGSRDPIIPAYLKEAGDPEWATWQPTFATDGKAFVTRPR